MGNRQRLKGQSGQPDFDLEFLKENRSIGLKREIFFAEFFTR
jgi:hypothetical protein